MGRPPIHPRIRRLLYQASPRVVETLVRVVESGLPEHDIRRVTW